MNILQLGSKGTCFSDPHVRNLNFALVLLFCEDSGHCTNHVGKRVGLDDENVADVGVLEHHSTDGVDVGLVLGNAIVGNVQLAVGGVGSTVTVGEVVDDEDAGVVAAAGVGGADLAEGSVNERNLGASVPETISKDQNNSSENNSHPLEGGYIGDLGGGGGEGAGQGGNGEAEDLGAVVSVGPLVDADKGVAGVGGAAGRAGSGVGGGDAGAGGPGGGAGDNGGRRDGRGGPRAGGRRGGGRGRGRRTGAGKALRVPGVVEGADGAGGAAGRARPAVTTALSPGRC